jgi:hypothetical protein
MGGQCMDEGGGRMVDGWLKGLEVGGWMDGQGKTR